jgi:hypothetical protein
MLTAYLDEAGQEGREDVIIAGYIGSDEAWDKLLIKWKAALYPRKSVHVRTLRWNGRRAAKLMAKLGPIPDECGLQRVIGHVRVADYADLFTEVHLRKLVPGYQMALHALINSVLRWIPKHEQVRFYFGRFVARRNNYESIPSGMLVHPTVWKPLEADDE